MSEPGAILCSGGADSAGFECWHAGPLGSRNALPSSRVIDAVAGEMPGAARIFLVGGRPSDKRPSDAGNMDELADKGGNQHGEAATEHHSQGGSG